MVYRLPCVILSWIGICWMTGCAREVPAPKFVPKDPRRSAQAPSSQAPSRMPAKTDSAPPPAGMIGTWEWTNPFGGAQVQLAIFNDTHVIFYCTQCPDDTVKIFQGDYADGYVEFPEFMDKTEQLLQLVQMDRETLIAVSITPQGKKEATAMVWQRASEDPWQILTKEGAPAALNPAAAARQSPGKSAPPTKSPAGKSTPVPPTKAPGTGPTKQPPPLPVQPAPSQPRSSTLAPPTAPQKQPASPGPQGPGVQVPASPPSSAPVQKDAIPLQPQAPPIPPSAPAPQKKSLPSQSQIPVPAKPAAPKPQSPSIPSQSPAVKPQNPVAVPKTVPPAAEAAPKVSLPPPLPVVQEEPLPVVP